ncbi:MAG: hypothetical protein WD646_13305 [Actinomycetota bacterium]
MQSGHFKVTWLVGAGLSAAAGFGYRPAWAITALSLAAFGAVYLEGKDRRRFGIDLVVGMAAAGVGVFALATGSDLELEAFAAAALLGSVTNAMLLGHWHLNQPRLGTKPIARLVWLLWVAIAVFIAASALLLAGATGVGLLGAWTSIAFAVFTGVLTAMVHHLVRTRSIMSATGILYLAILLCFVAAFTGSLSALARH